MKSFFKIFVILMGFYIIFTSNIFAITTFNINSSKDKIDEEINVEVSIQDNTGFVGYQLVLNYDITSLEYISSENGDLVNKKLAVLSDNNANGSIKQACVNQNSINEDGSLMKVKFKMKNDIDLDDIPITLKVQKLINDVGDGDVKDVEYNVSNKKSELDNNKNNVLDTTEKNKVNVIKDSNGKVLLKLKDESLNSKVKYRSMDESKVSVDSEGNVKYLSAGEAKIEVLIDDEIIDTVNLNITEDEISNLKTKSENNEVETKKIVFNKKYIITFCIIFALLVLGLICIIIYFNKRKRRNKNEK